MSKESSIPLTRTAMIEKGGREVPLTFAERYRRYPITDRDVKEILGLSDDGHHERKDKRRRPRK